MSNPVPSSLALSVINTSDPINSAPHRSNYAAIQSAVNALEACLSGGTAGQVLTAVDGSDVQWAAAPVPTQTIYSSGSGTYTVPTGCKAILVEALGGGGGGGGSGAGGNGTGCIGAASGGAGGQYARKLITSPAGSYDYVVGAGGGGGDATPHNGTAGGDTYLTAHLGNEAGAFCVAKGGAGGLSGGATYSGVGYGTAGAVGSATGGVGDLVAAGGSGDAGFALSLGNGSTTRVAKGGMGGASHFGSGGCGSVGGGGASNGAAGVALGSAGGGAALIDGGFGSGGAGAGGVLIITEFY